MTSFGICTLCNSIYTSSLIKRQQDDRHDLQHDFDTTSDISILSISLPLISIEAFTQCQSIHPAMIKSSSSRSFLGRKEACVMLTSEAWGNRQTVQAIWCGSESLWEITIQAWSFSCMPLLKLYNLASWQKRWRLHLDVMIHGSCDSRRRPWPNLPTTGTELGRSLMRLSNSSKITR